MTDNVRTLPTRRRKPATPTPRSHEEIYDLVVRANRSAEMASKLAADAVSRADLSHLTGQRVETKLDGLIRAVGGEGEDERGAKIGTGVVGRLMRLESNVSKRFELYDGWTKIVIGFTAAAGVFGGAIWWLTAGHLATVFGVK